jgi:predicted N-formylglutamate amidohydrolase
MRLPSDGVERIPGSGPSRLVLSCEHASRDLPDRTWHPEDAWLLDTHWAYDIGAGVLTRELAEAAGAPAVLAGFSRLFIDPNRPLDSDTLVRQTAEGRPIRLNAEVAPEELEERVGYWQSYHQAVDGMAGAPGVEILLAVHSFTPVYEGRERTLEVGVLFDRDDALGKKLALALSTVAITEENEPYSGKLGLIYAAQRHADTHGIMAVEIEVRQDLIIDPSFRQRVVRQVLAGLAP